MPTNKYPKQRLLFIHVESKHKEKLKIQLPVFWCVEIITVKKLAWNPR